jgi:hypothetical protein
VWGPHLGERQWGTVREDVKEYYFYLDSTPTHSYMKYLYKYPQAAYPYSDLVATNRDRGRGKPEYELLDTGIFDQDRYFDIFVEYAKASPEGLLIQITVHNRGSEAATLQLLLTLWFRNDWAWGGDVPRPTLRQLSSDESAGNASASRRAVVARRRNSPRFSSVERPHTASAIQSVGHSASTWTAPATMKCSP